MNLGFVGCIQSLTAGNMGLATVYNLEYPNPSSHIVDGLDIGKARVGLIVCFLEDFITKFRVKVMNI